MIKRDSDTLSPWQETNLESRAVSNLAKEWDVLIIGGGITGVTAALNLQQAGKNCLLVDTQTLGFGTTSGTTAHLNTFFDTTYPDIESKFSKEAAKLVAEAAQYAIGTIKTNIATYGFNCDFKELPGYLYAETEQEAQLLTDILEASKNAGVAVERSTVNGLPISFEAALCFDNQAQFHPTKYLKGLVDAFVNAGGSILENTFIEEVTKEDRLHVAKCKGLHLRATDLVYATHIPPGINSFSFRCAPYRSYVLGVTLADETSYPSCLSYDSQEPYHYFRTHDFGTHKLLIVGGEDHKTGHGDPSQAFQKLEAYVREHFPVKSITYRWSSQYYIPHDGLPYIGKMENDQHSCLVATGYNGNGMIWGTVAGRLLADLILEQENPWAVLLDPCRVKPMTGLGEMLKENADVAYHFVADRIKIDELESFNDLERGTGEVVIHNGKKVALYKDHEGLLKALNPICTHAHCVVQFNQEEQSWDCPCHGGRFDLNGEVLCGPPQSALPEIDLDEK